MKNWYKSLENSYSAFGPSEQILNMVSDLKKAQHFEGSNAILKNNHLYRAIILLDYIINDPKWFSKRGELLRLREVISSLIALCPMGTLEQTIEAALLMSPTAYKALHSKIYGQD